jgi:hypothetical protein
LIYHIFEAVLIAGVGSPAAIHFDQHRKALPIVMFGGFEAVLIVGVGTPALVGIQTLLLMAWDVKENCYTGGLFSRKTRPSCSTIFVTSPPIATVEKLEPR